MHPSVQTLGDMFKGCLENVWDHFECALEGGGGRIRGVLGYREEDIEQIHRSVRSKGSGGVDAPPDKNKL